MNWRPKRFWRPDFSIRDIVRLNTYFFLFFFFLTVTLSGTYLYRLQRTQAYEKVGRTLQEGEGRLSYDLELIEQNLRNLKAGLRLFELNPSPKAHQAYSELIAEALAPHRIQYNGYFAPEKKLSRKYFGKDGFIVTTHRDPSLSEQPDYWNPRRFQREIWDSPNYQTNQEEVWYHAAKRSQNVEFTDIYFDSTYMKRWMITAALGVYENGQFQGMVGIDLLLDDLVAEIESIRLGSTGGVILVDSRSNRVLTRLSGVPGEFIKVNERYSHPEFDSERMKQWQDLLAGTESISTFTGDNAKTYLVASMRLPDVHWTVLAFQEYNEAFQPVLLHVLFIVGMGLFGLFFLAATSSRTNSFIEKPLQRLIQSLMENIDLAARGEAMKVEAGQESYEEIRRVTHLMNHLVRVINLKTQQHWKLMEEQRSKALHSARMASIGEMAGNVAHEINSPLAAISLHAEVLQDELEAAPTPLPQSVHRVKVIRQVVERIAKTIRGLRSISREGSNDPLTETSLEQIVNDTIEICGARLRDSGIQLTVAKAPSARLQVRGVQISQVLLNLLNNSFDAIQGQVEKWISITFEETETTVRILVTDSGRGIAPEIVDKIMQPFFTTKEVNRGTGLGLSISKSIIEEHQGHLLYDASSPNTRFIVELPKKNPFS
jgi:C4-dicarboxylate-specific signal transduction histidine kinase